MFNRIFSQISSRLGMSGYAPSSGELMRTDDDENAPEAEARVTFLGGNLTPLSSDESVALKTADPNAALTTKDLVWPGKSNTIGFRNEEQQEYRYKLSITNLPASHYDIVPVHGPAQPGENGVLLRPGEEAAFDVRFRPEVRGKAAAQTFFFVLTRFDPRRSSDPGVIVGEEKARWVSLPDAEDFALEAMPGELRLRPWRREAPFQLALRNRSFLPSLVTLHILRGTTKQSLLDNPEQVDVLSQPLETRMSGGWRCVLPPSRLRNSYWVTVRGTARVGENYNVPITLLRPMYVRYTPWLRRGRDWAFMLGSAAAALWLVWGIPMKKAPLVFLRVQFQGVAKGELPKGLNSWDDLNVQIVSLNGVTLTTPIQGEHRDEAYVFEDFPKKWYGYRWPFNSWSCWGEPPKKFEVKAALKEDANADVSNKYNLARLKSKEAKKEANPDVFIIPDTRSAWGEWRVTSTATAQLAKRLCFKVTIGDAGALRQSGGANREITIKGKLDGQQVLDSTAPLSEQEPTTVEVTGRKGGKMTLWAVAGDLKSEIWSGDVQPQQAEFPVRLTFPAQASVDARNIPFRPGEKVTINGKHLGGKGTVRVDGKEVPATWTSSQISFNMPSELPAGQIPILVEPQGRDGLSAGAIVVHPVVAPNNPSSVQDSGAGSAPRRPQIINPPPKKNVGKPSTAGTSPGSVPDTSAHPSGGNSDDLPPPQVNKGTSPSPKVINSKPPMPAPGADNTNPGLQAFTVDELLALDETDAAVAGADTLLANPRANASTQGLAHAVKAIALLKSGSMTNVEDEINQAVTLTSGQTTGRARALALDAQALLYVQKKLPRDTIVNKFNAANRADHTLTLAWTDLADYYYTNDYTPQGDSQYTYGVMDNAHNGLFHYRFAQTFRKHGNQQRASEEGKAAIEMENNSKRKAVLRKYVKQMTDS